MTSRRFAVLLVLNTMMVAPSALAAKYVLLTGVDARLYPAPARTVIAAPGPGFPGTFYDGDRLAGTNPAGAQVNFNPQGIGTPLYQPNHLGSLSFMFRRGSVPAGPGMVVPFMGIDFLGGPRLDLDGNPNNAGRSYVPTGQAPAELGGVSSFVELRPDFANNLITLSDIDATGTNEGGPNVSADIATVLVTIAGTGPHGEEQARPNPAWDTRVGSFTPYFGTSGSLSGVYRITDVPFEIWQDSIDPNSASADTLGTFQYLGKLSGWLIYRQGKPLEFATLAGEGLGTTRWPYVDTSQVGQTYNTAHGLAGGTAQIRNGNANDFFSAAGNGGLPLTDFGGDLGAYLDQVVKPLVGLADSFVYLESAGFGINNSFDPVFTDTDGYDVVLVGAQYCDPCDANCDGSINQFDIQPFVESLQFGVHCSRCSADTNGDGSINQFDIQGFVECLGG